MADNNQLGTVLLKLLVDNKEFAEGLKNSLQLVSITSTQMKDLMEFKIEAPDFTALDLAVEVNQKKISELTKAQREQAAASDEESKAANEAGKKHREHGEGVDAGTKSIHEFRSEQRLQNFVIRESSQALLGLTSAVGFLSLNNTDAEGTQKKFQNSLLTGVTAANAMEFGLFGVGQATRNVKGQFGDLIRSIVAVSGPIAALVGVSAGLISFLGEEDRRLKELNEKGLDLYIKKLTEASGTSTQFLQKVTASLEAQKKSLTELQNISKNLGGGGLTTSLIGPGSALTQQAFAQGDVTRTLAQAGLNKQLEQERDQHDEIVKKLQREIKEQEILNDAIKRANAEIVANGSSVDRLRIQIGDLNDDIAHGLLTDDERRKKIDERIAKERELANLMKSTLQIEQERLGNLQTMNQLNQATTDEVVAQIDTMLKLKLTDQERLALEKTRMDLIQAERDLETAAYSDRLRAIEEEKNKRKEIVQTIHDLTLQATRNEFIRRQAEEDKRFADAAEKIEKEGRLQGATIDGTFLHTKEAQDALAANEAAHIEANAQIRIAKVQAEYELRQFILADTFQGELERIERQYAEEESRARDLRDAKQISEEQYIRYIAALRLAKDREIAQVELASNQRVLGAAQSIISNVVGTAAHLGPEAQRFVDTLQRGIGIMQSILAIAQTIKALTSFFSFLGLQDGGIAGSPVSPYASQAQDGVIVPGTGDGDKIPILAEPGEGIINKKAVQALGGPKAIERINRAFPRFASGGVVGNLPIMQEIQTLAIQASQIEYPSIIAALARQSGFNKESFDALIDEVRMLREDVKSVRRETRDLAERIKINIPSTIEIKASGRDLKTSIRLDEESNQ